MGNYRQAVRGIFLGPLVKDGDTIKALIIVVWNILPGSTLLCAIHQLPPLQQQHSRYCSCAFKHSNTDTHTHTHAHEWMYTHYAEHAQALSDIHAHYHIQALRHVHAHTCKWQVKWYVCTHLVSSHKCKTVPEGKRAGVFCL